LAGARTATLGPFKAVLDSKEGRHKLLNIFYIGLHTAILNYLLASRKYIGSCYITYRALQSRSAANVSQITLLVKKSKTS
jgi:hypothetical protein